MEFGRARCPTVARGVWLRAQAVFRPSCKRVWGAHRARVQTTAATMRRRSVAGEGKACVVYRGRSAAGAASVFGADGPAREAPIAVLAVAQAAPKASQRRPKETKP
eukprot:scaffold3082_cov119-Isochrysis_galbana.AAC.2